MAIFDEKIEIRERCKGVHCVDLGESFPTRIYLQKSASIQPRTSPSKFEGKFNSLFTSLLRLEYMDLEKGDRVLFQVEINERGQPAVMRIVKFKKDWGDEDEKFDTSLKMGRVR